MYKLLSVRPVLYRNEQVHSVVYWGVVSLYTNNL